MPRKKRANPKWTPFERCDMDHYREHLAKYNDALASKPKLEVWRNSRYQVLIAEHTDFPIGVPIIHLSIKRIDKREVHDWRDLQRIKTELCGPEREAVELYPAESRMVDEANQYHLWVFPEGMMAPFGYFGNRVVHHPDKPDGTNPDGSRQRPFEEGYAENIKPYLPPGGEQ